MKSLKISEIVEAVKGKLISGDETLCVSSVCQDSRLAKEGSIFFAIKGDAFDGHNFISSAKSNGCSAVVLENIDAIKNIDTTDLSVILVDDTVLALQNLSKSYLSKLNLKKIAVTGSTGKTSTRDMTYYICKEKYSTQKNQGNFNTVVGVPLTIMEFDEDIEVAVIEMGMDRPGEIDTMEDIVRPDIGIITNIGVSHLENFDNKREGIFNAKMEITNYFDESNILIVTDSEEYLNKENIKGDFKLILTGDKNDDAFVVSDIDQTSDDGVRFKVTYKDESEEFFVPVLGKHNAFNATLAIAAGRQLGVSFKEAKNGLKKMELTGKRLAIKKNNDIKVIDDTYNASPDSMKAALDILSKTVGNRHVAVLGDMYELGSNEAEFHKEVGKFAREKADELFSIGELAKEYEADRHFDTVDEFVEATKDYFKPGDVVLVKASRGMALEQVVAEILK